MKKLIKKLAIVFYIIFARWLPRSSSRCKVGLLTRRFYGRLILKKAGKKINIERGARFGRGVTLGDYSGIGVNCEVFGDVSIGNDVMMGPEVVFYTTNHKFDRTDIPMRLQGTTESKGIVIGNDVWIGRRAIILPGVTIGDGVVIGAGAVVAKDIPSYSVVVGNPARVIKKRNEQQIKQDNI